MLPRSAYASDDEFRSALRDMFAGQALAGFCANIEFQKAATRVGMQDGRTGTDFIAAAAYEYADAMLAERAKGGAS